MNRYFLPKTGWEFFDVSRAYGVVIIVHALSGDAIVSDMGGFYLIESKRESFNPTLVLFQLTFFVFIAKLNFSFQSHFGLISTFIGIAILER